MDALLRSDPLLIEILLEQPHRAELAVAIRDPPHGLGLRGQEYQLTILDRVAERGDAAHRHPLLLRSGDLVADAFPDDLALELSERQQNVEGEPPHRRCGVELLRDRNERGRMP